MQKFIKKDFVDTIGNTPLIKLNKASEITGCEIYGKAEFLNPGSSIKDRAAKGIILDAIAKKNLLPGGTIVEGTAGNTGIGLGLVGNSLGYKTLIVMPETQSQEKKDALKLIGCELKLVPALPYSNPGNYIRQSEKIAENLRKTSQNGVLWANQFDNIANQMSHYNSTGPEIWEQTSGKIDGFTCAVGTGGTLSGTGLFLKEKNKNIKIALTDPYGSGLYNYYENGEMKAEGNSITEGIGQGRITKNLENCPVDLSFRTDDNQALNIIFDLLKEEGLFLGGSSGINVAGAIKLAKELGPGKTIVTILCDSGQRYQSKIWNPSFLKSKDLVVPNWLQKEID
jgi:cysteine synthase A